MSSSISSATASASASSSHAAGLVDQGNSKFKIVGIALAVGSGFLIGASFVIKKKGLINSTKKYGNVAGEGHGYLKSWMWWAGMITMILGEICNFVAYAFTEAILVTPMGALSVVVAAILSHFLLKEKLTFFGWIGCVLCIIGAVILALNAPEQQSVTTINEFKKYFLSVGFLVWASLLIAASLVLVFFVAPRWGKKSMMPYIAICSLIGGISVSCTQGLGASIVTSIQGNNQVKNWFFWFLFVFVVVTLLTEINYLNKALELFNTSMVVPVYFCFFSSATLITSFILYQGLKASAVTLITMVLGFLVTCLGITLLQLSKVDPESLDKLDRKSTMLMAASKHQTEDAEKGEVTASEDPGMDALRGGFGAVGSIIRARSLSRRMSNASSMSGGKMYGYSSGNLSTHGMGNLQRFQLSDAPMPADAMDQISLHSAKSPSALSAHGFQSGQSYFPSPQRSKSQLKASPSPLSSPSPVSASLAHILLKPLHSPSSSAIAGLITSTQADLKGIGREQFEEADVVHQYHYGTAPDTSATHTYRPHSNIPPSPIHTFSGHVQPPMGLGHRQLSAGSVLSPITVVEEEEEFDEKDSPKNRAGGSGSRSRSRVAEVEEDNIRSAPPYLGSGGYSDPYADLHPYSDSQQIPPSPSHRGLGGLFKFHSGPDLSFALSKQGRRGSKSPSRKSGDRDDKHEFPQMSKRDKNDQVEREERVALVHSGDAEAFDDDENRIISPGGSGSEAEDGRTVESSTYGHGDAEATIGVGHRINLSHSSSSQPSAGTTPTRPQPPQIRVDTGSPSTSTPGSSSSSNARMKGPRGSKTVAGPRYQ